MIRKVNFPYHNQQKQLLLTCGVILIIGVSIRLKWHNQKNVLFLCLCYTNFFSSFAEIINANKRLLHSATSPIFLQDLKKYVDLHRELFGDYEFELVRNLRNIMSNWFAMFYNPRCLDLRSKYSLSSCRAQCWTLSLGMDLEKICKKP